MRISLLGLDLTLHPSSGMRIHLKMWGDITRILKPCLFMVNIKPSYRVYIVILKVAQIRCPRLIVTRDNCGLLSNYHIIVVKSTLQNHYSNM